MGRAAGDELLIEVSTRLTALVRKRDVVARLGGDEFAIVEFNLRHIEDAQATAKRLLVGGGKWQVSATGSNLANKIYYISVFDLRSEGAGADFALLSPPREFSIQAEHKF